MEDRMRAREKHDQDADKQYRREQKDRILQGIIVETKKAIAELELQGMYGYGVRVTDTECIFVIYIDCSRSLGFEAAYKELRHAMLQKARQAHMQGFDIAVERKPNEAARNQSDKS